MSVTTTANPVSSAVLQVLTNYDVHHSGDPEQPKPPQTPNNNARPLQPTETPEQWDHEHRRVPSYRAINRSNLGPERPAGSNSMESAFIFLMLNGVGVISGVNRVWRATGGKVNDKIFRYQIGGEW